MAWMVWCDHRVVQSWLDRGDELGETTPIVRARRLDSRLAPNEAWGAVGSNGEGLRWIVNVHKIEKL